MTVASAAARLGADYVGLIQAAGPRRVPLETARQIAAALPPTTQPVLLFRDASLDELAAVVVATAVRWLQLHGAEPLAYVRELRQRYPATRLIKAWPVSGP